MALILPFTKIVATGNDFLFIDARNLPPAPIAQLTRAELARRMCDIHSGAGADGLVFVEQANGKLRWDFYNNDGSHAEMCGNASRCMGRWAVEALQISSIEFATAAGQVRAEEIAPDLIVSHLDYLQVKFEELTFEAAGETKQAVFLNTGVPHVVYQVDHIEHAKTETEVIHALRFHPATGERGTNVTFLQIVSPEKFLTVTYERGVEGFTLSCGTGVLAAAAVGLRKLGREGQVELETPGGSLKVTFGANWRGAALEGSAQVIYEGRFRL